MRSRTRLLAGLTAVVAVTLTVLVASGAAATGPTNHAAKAAPPKIGLVTDIGGLNDRSFNHLAYLGLERAHTKLGVPVRVLESKSNADYVPNLRLARAAGLLARDRGRLPDGRRGAAGGQELPEHEVRDHRRRVRRRATRRTSRACCSTSRRPGTWSATSRACVEKGASTISSVGGQKIPPVDRYIAGYKAGAKAANPEHHRPERLLAGLRRPGEVQGPGPAPDRPGLEGRLPGRRRLRARRARRREAEARLGHRRRRRPGLPRLAHPDERRQARGRRRLHDDHPAAERHLQVRAARSRSRSTNGGVGIGKISAKVPKADVKKVMAIKAKIAPRQDQHPDHGAVERQRRADGTRGGRELAPRRFTRLDGSRLGLRRSAAYAWRRIGRARRPRPRAPRHHQALPGRRRERRRRPRPARAARCTRCSARTGPASRR